jgi:hypothetical protein
VCFESLASTIPSLRDHTINIRSQNCGLHTPIPPNNLEPA